MSPFTSEESITNEFITNEKPDVIINVVDSTNLSRSLFFTSQLLELGIPVVVALNKFDINEKKHNDIDIKKLSNLLGSPVIQTTSTTNKGLKSLISTALSLVGKGQAKPFEQGEVDYNSKTSVENADKKRFEFVKQVVAQVEVRKSLTKTLTWQDKLDDILTHKVFGILIFAIVMFLVFWISQVGPGVWLVEGITLSSGFTIPGLTTLITNFGNFINSLMVGVNPVITSLLVDGIIGGVGSVVGFLPLVMVMYFLIALLEDCGYMARVSVILDPIFKKVGLSGKSVIPFVIGTGCAVPGVMACRTIKDERERRATAMLAPFMPCGAKLPLIALFAGAFFAKSSWVGPLMYFLGIVIIFVGALLVKLITGNKYKKTYFIIELPEYKIPSIKRALISMLSRGWAYIVKAGTIILLCNFLVQLMQTFNFNLQPVEDASNSILATISTPFAYLFAPFIGIVAWQLAAACITGFIAKENVVGTLAVCIVGLENFIDVEQLQILQGAGANVAGLLAITKVAGLSFLMFNLFSPPCFAAIGAMNSELNSKKWLLFALAFQLGMGYTIAFLTFFFGSLFTGAISTISPWMIVVGFIITLTYIGVITYLIIKRNKETKLIKWKK